MKRSASHVEIEPEPEGEVEVKRKVVSLKTFQKWRTEMDRDLKTISWLSSSEAIENGKKIVKELKCSVCAKFRIQIMSRRNFSDYWITGASSIRTSNIRDHAKSDQHLHAMSLFQRERFASNGPSSSTAAAPIVVALTTLQDDERARLRKKMDVAYFVAKEKMSFQFELESTEDSDEDMEAVGTEFELECTEDSDEDMEAVGTAPIAKKLKLDPNSIPLPPPSLFKDCEVFKDVCMDFVDYHTLRSSIDSPPCNLEVPPTLVCRAFEDFIVELKSPAAPTVEFISIANQLAAVQSYCHTQDERVTCNKIQKILSNKAFCGDCIVGPIEFSRPNTKGSTCLTFCVDILHKDTCIARIEFKKYIAEATRENIGYFVQMNSIKMFLISMFDGRCDVLGAIRMKKDGKDHIVVSPLAESVNFFLHPIDEIRSDEVMLNAAKFLQALAAGIVSLKDEYQRSPSTFSAASAQELFALLPQFNGEIHINKRLGSLTFGGISQGGSSVVVKFFAQKYGIAVQRCLHNAGLAPEVLKEVKVGRVWSACVMTNVEGKTLFECLRDNSLTEDAKKDICKQLSCIKNVLTSEGYVHGDLRSSNIIVAANNKLCVVDFSWAGKSLDVRYPWSLNCSSIRWHPGVGCGKKISTEHDNFLIDILIEDLSGTSSKSQT
eukprot:Em0001g1995a